MTEYEKIAASLRHCANGIGNCRICCEYGEESCSKLLKQDAADAIEELLKKLDKKLEQTIRVPVCTVPPTEKEQEAERAYELLRRRLEPKEET